jgi:transcriptional regulator with XRE-family HTH domain
MPQPARDAYGRAFASMMGKAIRHARVQAGMTGVALAEAVGVKPQNISAIELGSITPSFQTLHRMAVVLGQPVWVLVKAAEAGIDVKERLEARERWARHRQEVGKRLASP